MRSVAVGEACKSGHIKTAEMLGSRGQCLVCQAESMFRASVRTGKVLPPETEADVHPYKEPLEPVDEGFGYKGTVAQNKTGTHVQCHICGYFFGSLGIHIPKIHGISADEYRQKFQLAARTALASETTKERYRQASIRRLPELKAKFVSSQHKRLVSLEGIEVGASKKSLEQKNREGRCYYQLLDKIEALGKKLGKTPTGKDFITEYGKGYYGSVTDTYGSWNQALSLAGFTPTNFSGGRAKYSRDMVIASIRNFYEIEGRPPRVSDMGHGIPNGSVIRRLFGGIVDARKAAGLGQYDYVHEVGGYDE